MTQFEGTILEICQHGQWTVTQNLTREQDNPWAQIMIMDC